MVLMLIGHIIRVIDFRFSWRYLGSPTQNLQVIASAVMVGVPYDVNELSLMISMPGTAFSHAPSGHGGAEEHETRGQSSRFEVPAWQRLLIN